MKLQRQINNIKIYKRSEDFVCKSPDGRLLEDFKKIEDAISWCKSTWDFTRYNKGLRMDN